MAIWKPDPAIAEFRAVKDAYAAEFNFDIDAICDHLVSVERTSGQTYTKARNAGLMPGAFGFLPSRSAGGAGGGPLSVTDRCRASPAASAGRPPLPASPASGGGESRTPLPSVPINDRWYYVSYPPRRVLAEAPNGEWSCPGRPR